MISVNRVGWEPVEAQLSTLNSQLSTESGIQFWGSSMVVGPQGEYLYRAPKDEEVCQVVTISMERSEQVRRWWPFLRDRRIDAYGDLLKRFAD